MKTRSGAALTADELRAARVRVAENPLHLEGAVPAAACARWLAAIEPHYGKAGPAAAGPDVKIQSSSLRLAAVPGLAFADVVEQLAAAGLLDRCRDMLGGAVACLVDQCWARRQYPASARPARHAAHSWHQDGALAFDFAAHPARPLPATALLAMRTCWLPLTDCGVHAPGLEWSTHAIDGLLAPEDLADAAVQARFGPGTSRHPPLRAGDALLFDGALLHRTHVTPSMTRTRTSLELRFLAAHALPPRLAGQHLVVL